jgi:hypothetical protein
MAIAAAAMASRTKIRCSGRGPLHGKLFCKAFRELAGGVINKGFGAGVASEAAAA